MFFGLLEILLLSFTLPADAAGSLTELACKPVFTAVAYSVAQEANFRKYEDTALKDIPFLGVKDLALALRQDLETISSGFQTSPASAMGHILTGNIYEDWTSRSHRLNGGMHTLDGRRDLAMKHWKDVGFSIEADPNRANIEDYQKRVIKNPESEEIREMKALNLDPTKIEDFYFYLLAHEKSHSGPLILDNGVVQYRFGKNVFNSAKWKESVRGAAIGRAPAGAKTLFPATWNDAKIQTAVLHVLNDEKSRVLSLQPKPDKSGIQKLMLEGEYEGVYISVAIAGGQVNSAYPSWVQDRTMTPRDLRREARHHADRAPVRVETISRYLKEPYPKYFEDITGYYLGKSLDPTWSSDATWHLYLNPALRPNGRADRPNVPPGGSAQAQQLYGLGSSAQYHIEHFLMNSRLLEDARTNIAP